MVLMGVTGYFDLILALEAGLLSIFGSLLIYQTLKWWKDKSERLSTGFGVFAILLIGAFLYLQLVVLSGYVVPAYSGMITSHRLREIVIALHKWQQDHHSLPAIANYSADGKPLLSWRVHLLPYLGQEELYKRFHLDESWDSPHNLSLLSSIPVCYRLPQYGRQAPWGGTYYQLIVGPGAVFVIGKQTTIPQIVARKRMSSTIIAGIAQEAVPWTKPADLAFDVNQPLGLGKVMRHLPTPVASMLPWWSGEPGESNRVYRVVCADGAVRSTSAKHLQALGPFIIWNGEEPKDLGILD